MQKNDAFPSAGLPLASDCPLQCLFCGEPEQAELLEIWGHDFMLQTCCEGLHEQIVIDMNDDPAWGRELLRRLEIEPLTGHRLRRVTDDGCTGIILDWQLQHGTVSAGEARRFIARHHAHCGMPTAWRFHGAVFNGRTLMGVALVGNPVARALSGRGILEINRLCIRRDTPAALRWNAASMLYGWCSREAERRGWQKIITYTRVDEPGTSLEAAGWQREACVRGRGWHSAQRARSNRNGWIDKIRWSRSLAPRLQSTPPPKRSKPPCAASMWTGWTTVESAFGFTPA
ncbi:XF1762 family protein [Acidisoma silvae]|uniref:Uncharacterized protein n=1 Tax=Acidisoma silvae TaxID=2802396 RepID=A0A964E111_9PROT|nr:XF1762 family protein [Acidisoma silvae]MCB8877876.1 hypothetical protein [Acidisoma silvae]